SQAGTVTLANAPGNILQFTRAGFLTPNIQASGNGTINVNGRIDIGSTFFDLEGSSTATINLNAPITGSGTLSLDAVNKVFNVPATFTGQTFVNTGTAVTSIGVNDALGMGSITWQSGVVQNANAGVTTPNIVTLDNLIQLAGAMNYKAPAQA